MHLTKASVAAILAFASSVAAMPRVPKAFPTMDPKDVANGTWSNHTVTGQTATTTATAITTQSLNSTSSSTQAATPTGATFAELINMAVHIEQQPVLEGLRCIITCWKENKDEDGNSDKAAYRGCLSGCGTKDTFDAPTGKQNMTEKVSKAAIEAGAKLRNSVVEYFHCMLEGESEACIAAIVGRSWGWMPDDYKTQTTPTISMPTSMPAKEPTAPTETASEAEEY